VHLPVNQKFTGWSRSGPPRRRRAGVPSSGGLESDTNAGVHEAYPRDAGEVLPRGIPDRKEAFQSDKRIYRGGSWNTFAKYLRCANREATSDGKRWVYVGFRCAVDPPWREPGTGQRAD